MKRFLLLAFVFCMPSLALAQRAPEIPIFPLGVVINAAEMDAPANTGWLDVTGYKLLVLDNNLTRVAATSVSVACKANRIASDTGAGDLQVISGSTSTDLALSKTVIGNKIWPWRIDVNGFRFVKCTYTAASGGTTDLLTVTADKARGE